jgi:hypothetical protein
MHYKCGHSFGTVIQRITHEGECYRKTAAIYLEYPQPLPSQREETLIKRQSSSLPKRASVLKKINVCLRSRRSLQAAGCNRRKRTLIRSQYLDRRVENRSDEEPNARLAIAYLSLDQLVPGVGDPVEAPSRLVQQALLDGGETEIRIVLIERTQGDLR